MPNAQEFLEANGKFGWFVRVVPPGEERIAIMRNWEHDRGPEARTEDWRIDMEWNYDISPYANWGKVDLLNALEPMIRQFTYGDHVGVHPGWQKGDSEIVKKIDGTIQGVMEFRESEVSRGSRVFFVDAPEHTLTKITKRWWPPGTTYETVFFDLLGDLGLQLQIYKPVQNGRYKDGMTVFGPIWPNMLMVAADMGSRLYVYDRFVRLMPPTLGIKTDVELTPLTGLKRVQKAWSIPHMPRTQLYLEDFEADVFNVVALLETEIEPDSVIKITQPGKDADAGINGEFRVIRGSDYANREVMYSERWVVPSTGVVNPSEDARPAPESKPQEDEPEPEENEDEADEQITDEGEDGGEDSDGDGKEEHPSDAEPEPEDEKNEDEDGDGVEEHPSEAEDA